MSQQARSHRNFRSEITPKLSLVKEQRENDEDEKSVSKSSNEEDELPTMQELAGNDPS